MPLFEDSDHGVLERRSVGTDMIGREMGFDQNQIDIVTTDRSPLQGMHVVAVRIFAEATCEIGHGERAVAAGIGKLLRRRCGVGGGTRKDQCGQLARRVPQTMAGPATRRFNNARRVLCARA